MFLDVVDVIRHVDALYFQERDKGKTVEVGRAYFETEKRHFTILDAPGHNSFVPNMIGGAAQADVAILVSAHVGTHFVTHRVVGCMFGVVCSLREWLLGFCYGQVISARRGEFETGFERRGQTREHAMLVKTAGVKHLVILINKMDDPTVKWDETRSVSSTSFLPASHWL